MPVAGRQLGVLGACCQGRHGRTPTFFDTFSFADVQSAGLARLLELLGRLPAGATRRYNPQQSANRPTGVPLRFTSRNRYNEDEALSQRLAIA